MVASDVRQRGFADRATLEEVHAWADRHAQPLGVEEVRLDDAVGRVLAAPLVAAGDYPLAARAGLDGYAVRAADTVGASSWNPLALRIQPAAEALGPGAAALVSAGAALPVGADAVLGFDAAQPNGLVAEAIAPVPEGAGVERAGQQLRAGAPVPGAGRPLGPRGVALLAALGVERVPVVARPRIRVVVAGPKHGAHDAHVPLLRALVARDAGVLELTEAAAGLRETVRRAAHDPAPDLLVVTGRTGTGPDDEAPLALAEVGRLELHGVALRPGGSVGMGVAGEVPVVLLPGDPLACLVGYELVAGRLVRRLAGRGPDLPHATTVAEVARKIVSAVGVVEVCQIRLSAAGVMPLGIGEFGGLAAAARADGFVVVPAALEGYAPGAQVTVHLY